MMGGVRRAEERCEGALGAEGGPSRGSGDSVVKMGGGTVGVQWEVGIRGGGFGAGWG